MRARYLSSYKFRNNYFTLQQVRKILQFIGQSNKLFTFRLVVDLTLGDMSCCLDAQFGFGIGFGDT